MGNKANYIKWIRSKVGHEKIILVFAGGCIFNEKGEILLQRRGDTNKWGFPGGAIELGETPKMAAVREAKEETGVDVKVGNLIGLYTDCDMMVTGGELFCDKDETLELKYFPLNGLPELFCKQHEELADDIQKIYE